MRKEHCDQCDKVIDGKNAYELVLREELWLKFKGRDGGFRDGRVVIRKDFCSKVCARDYLINHVE